MLIAASTVDLTPDRPVSLVGYAGAPRKSQGIRSRLESNAILFETNGGRALFAGVDALFVCSDFIELVRDKLIDPSAQLLFIATHTHYGPSLDLSKPKLGETDTQWFATAAESVASQLNKLLRDSVSAAGMSYGTVPCALNMHRRRMLFFPKRRPPFLQRAIQMMPNPDRRIPNDLQLMELHTENGTPLAVIWSWPCHPVEASDRNRINAAFPGAVRAAIRSELGSNVPVIFLPGFCGDIRPAMTRSSARSAFVDSFKIPTEQEVEVFEAGVSAAALRALSAARPFDVPRKSFFRRSELSLSALMDDAVATMPTMPISHLTCGPFSLTALGAEVCSPYLGHLGFDPAQPAFFTGCADQTFGYLPTDVQIDEGGYEAERFKGFFEVAGRWKPDVMRRVIVGLRTLQEGRHPVSNGGHEAVEHLLLSRLVEIDG